MTLPYADWDDVTLARQAVTDAEAFDVLYRRYVTPVYRYCYARVNQEADAEDLTSQIFEAALHGLKQYRGHSAFAAWLFGIARRKCADFHRRQYAHVTVDEAVLVERFDPTAPDPEETAFLAQVLDCVRRSLAALSADRVEALHLRYWGGLEYDEIAAVMRRRREAIKMLISRGLSDLRERCVR